MTSNFTNNPKMKKLQIKSEAVFAVCCSLIQFVCTVIVVLTIVNADNADYRAVWGIPILYLTIAGLLEYAKYKAIHVWYGDSIRNEFETQLEEEELKQFLEKEV